MRQHVNFLLPLLLPLLLSLLGVYDEGHLRVTVFKKASLIDCLVSYD